jgi:hypothetical protein
VSQEDLLCGFFSFIPYLFEGFRWEECLHSLRYFAVSSEFVFQAQHDVNFLFAPDFAESCGERARGSPGRALFPCVVSVGGVYQSFMLGHSLLVLKVLVHSLQRNLLESGVVGPLHFGI